MFCHFRSCCVVSWGKKLIVNEEQRVLEIAQFREIKNRRHQYRGFRLPHECRSWKSPTANSRNRVEPAAENKNCSGTNEIGMEQQAQRLLVPHRPRPCPACGQGHHDTHRIFKCPAHPSSLSPMDLLTNTNLQFLGLDLKQNPRIKHYIV
ncbi:hypothetical protein FF38_11079 [Lucilia cuprina]|uniref:Uncharacterized protein n=1 Tax=Lucilia cuprina TaxID=7375 RepID=A0A0L0CRI5_LUCCU|nr:hypothetical protein FF38_11079 [Lucilia cuprina]